MKQPSTKAEFDAVLAEAAAAGKAVVVDFTATWCGPCQRIAPLYAQLASEFPQADFIKVDVDENQETAAACQVSAMPTFMIFRDKKEVGMIRGADPDGLRALIQQHAGDKWSVAGEGQSLGSAQDTGGMSEREKRLAALERELSDLWRFAPPRRRRTRRRPLRHGPWGAPTGPADEASSDRGIAVHRHMMDRQTSYFQVHLTTYWRAIFAVVT